jgi:type II secretory pathway pseudopilin PulG
MAVSPSITRNNGFSFLELMLCVAILAASGLVVLQAFSLALKLQLRGSDILAASGVAQEKVQELSYMENRGALASGKGGATGEKGRFSWEYSLVPDDEQRLQRMELSLRWSGRNRQDNLNLSAYFIDGQK